MRAPIVALGVCLFAAAAAADREIVSKVAPNPFRNGVNVEYSPPCNAYQTAVVFDVLGRVVRSYEARRVAPKTQAHMFLIDGSDWPTGVYFFRLTFRCYGPCGPLLVPCESSVTLKLIHVQ